MKKPRFKYPSVTEVLEPYVDFSMVKPADLEAAKVRGTIVHGVCAGFTRFGVVVNLPVKYQGYLESFKKFYINEIAGVKMVEQRIYNDAVRLCGQPDLVVIRIGEGVKRVLDLKTPTRVYSTWKGQIAAYKWLYDQFTGTATDMPGHVRLKENGGYPDIYIMRPDEYKTELEMFFKILTAYHHYV